MPKIAEFRDLLKNSSASLEARLEALKFITHFIGDLHQPLHVSDDHDRGGNEVHVRFFGKSMNLHSVWDAGIIDHAGLDEDTFASELLNNIDATKIASIQAGSVIDWTNATHTLAKPHVYKLPGGDTPKLGQNYYDLNADTVDATATRQTLAEILGVTIHAPDEKAIFFDGPKAVKIMVTGKLFDDSSHFAENHPKTGNHRGSGVATLWEVHPVWRVEPVP